MAEKKSAKAQVKQEAAKTSSAANRVKKQYDEEVVPFLMKKFGYASVMQVPKIEKIVIMEECPERWTYPEIQPKLLAEAKRRGLYAGS